MANTIKDTQGTSNISTLNRPEPIQPNNYQDEAASHESKLKAVWDAHMGTVKNESVFYRNAVVLLISWHQDIDDLHTGEEVARLERVFQDDFHYKTVRKELTQDSERTPQIQVNKYLADFVYDYNDTSTLLIVYYAGHGRPGESKGGLNLAGSRSLVTEDSSELHEIVWNSAENNIKQTKSDVLVIFDCCHAGELEKNIRSGFKRRAFEYLAATSANSTTRKPGKHSFTTALIWALKTLVATEKSFSTQDLLTNILCKAPDFPEEQSPRLSERGSSCLRRIVLAPLSKDIIIEAAEAKPQEEEEGPRTDLSLRFVFNRCITQDMVKDLAVELRRLICGDDFKAATILWEGINSSNSTRYEDSILHFYAHRWLRHSRKKSGISPIEPTPRLEPSGPPLSSDESHVVTPNQEETVPEPGIGQDEGLPQSNSVPKLSKGESPSSRRKGEGDGSMNASRKRRKTLSISESGVEDERGKYLTPQKRPRRAVGGGQTASPS